ncbi:hypothetical protein G9H14_03860 [Klebsiella pneumoniae]|uniref:hypothetical protein n=1 Tax=Klebsiella pneumoniae TaxID=573 RepID=UPI0015E7AAAF|nr:hypothetical protein [Klebsiella pneumoniae]MBA1485965.1 hypothetical protein [Klebsiella pneumoniae]
MTSKLTREQLRERAQLKAKNLASAISQSAFASCRSELEEELQFLQCALACMEDEPVEPIWGAKKYPVCRPVPGAKLIVWDETGKFVGYGSSVDTRESGVAIQISVGHRLDSNHDLRWQYALQPVPAMNSEPHPDDELSNLLWYSQEATCHSDPNYYCEFQRLATPGFISGIILELQERRKAEMNSEPYGFTDGDRRGMIYEPQYADRLNNPIPVYRHAQPAPEREPVFFIEVEGDDWINAGRIEGKNRPDLGLLPDGINYLYAIPQPLTDAEREELQERRKADSEPAIIVGDDGGDALAYRRLIQSFSPGTKLYRHAQPAPVVPDEMAITEDMNLYQKSFAQGHNACRAAMLQAGNSPVIPDGWKLVPVEPNGDMLAAAQDAYGETEGDIASTLRAAITAAPQEVKGE